MLFIDIYSTGNRIQTCKLLYELLEERDPVASISHDKMPTFEQHVEFVESKPYTSWYFIMNLDEEVLGSIYLTKNNEIGVFIRNQYQGRGHGERAAIQLIKMNGPGRYYANIAPMNMKSEQFFTKLGFTLLQKTFKLDV